MKKTSQDPASRRKFLTLGILGGASLIASPAAAMKSTPDDGETVSMLTPDGKLVEVPKSAVSSAGKSKKTGNKDILDWVKPPKTAK